MAKPWVPYVVQQGDHLEKLAFRFGSDPDTVWNNAKNKDLKARRKNRDTLCAGDVLFVPGEPPPALDLQVGTTNSFEASVPKVPVKLTLGSKKGPLAGKAFVVDGAGGAKPIEGTTSASGEIAFEVPVSIREVTVRVPELALLLPVHVGGLDPIEERSGIVQRLSNLGYLAKTPEVPIAYVAQALRRFQRDHDLEPTGEVDAKTKDALEKEHGS
jgi:hypothetical protein